MRTVQAATPRSENDSVNRPSTSTVFRFVILIGVVNLFADLTYEGARSITGPFLSQLGGTR
jgi:hypothetical protein